MAKPNQRHSKKSHTEHHPLTDAQIANIVFNETRSLSGDEIAAARKNIAHTIVNAEKSPHRMPQMASKSAHVPDAEQSVMDDCTAAVAAAKADAIDPTNGATHFNFRNGSSKVPFQGFAIQTNIGPLDNSYPTHALPSTQIYANTYQ